MQVNKVANQPNFQAKFIRNDDIKDFCRKEINSGRDEELIKTLNDLSKHHSNVVLQMNRARGNNGYEITNLYNMNTVTFPNMTTNDLERISDIKSNKYKALFVGEKKITERKTNSITDKIADAYFVKAAPNYDIGHRVDISY